MIDILKKGLKPGEVIARPLKNILRTIWSELSISSVCLSKRQTVRPVSVGSMFYSEFYQRWCFVVKFSFVLPDQLFKWPVRLDAKVDEGMGDRAYREIRL